MRLVKKAFMCLLPCVRFVPPACCTFAASSRVTAATEHTKTPPFSSSSCERNDMVGGKFTRTGNPVRRPFVSWTFQPVSFDMGLDFLFSPCDGFLGDFSASSLSHTF